MHAISGLLKPYTQWHIVLCNYEIGTQSMYMLLYLRCALKLKDAMRAVIGWDLIKFCYRWYPVTGGYEVIHEKDA